MLDLLQVHDPLAEKKVTITIRLQADSPRRDQRTALVVVGVEGEAPILRSGPFHQLDEMIAEAWRRYGTRQPATPAIPAATGEAELPGGSTTIIEVEVERDEPAAATSAPATREGPGPATGGTKPAAAKPKASILDLF